MKKQLLIFILIVVSLSALAACTNSGNSIKNSIVVNNNGKIVSTEAKEISSRPGTKNNNSAKANKPTIKKEQITTSHNNSKDLTDFDSKTTTQVPTSTDFSTSNMSENTVAKTTQSVTDNYGWINKWYWFDLGNIVNMNGMYVIVFEQNKNTLHT